MSPNPHKFIGIGAMDVTKPYEFIGFGAMGVAKPYKFMFSKPNLWGPNGLLPPGNLSSDVGGEAPHLLEGPPGPPGPPRSPK